MFWDKISGLYDLFENVYNGKVFENLGKKVAELIYSDDYVLECACGTGAITKHIAKKCKKMIATDFSRGMLLQTAKKCKKYDNILIRRADITRLKCRDERFDKVVAGNVIHLLESPYDALHELLRVCKKGGKVIIPTYINKTNVSSSIAAKVLDVFGADFKRQFDLESYKKFFEDGGFKKVEYFVVEGKMPCAIAIITK